MKNFLVMILLIGLNACSLMEESDANSISNGSTVYYGVYACFTYSSTIEIGSMTWTRSEKISSGTYIYKSTVSYTTDGWTSCYYDESTQTFVEEYNEGETVTYIFYMKVEEMSTGIALYPTTTSRESAIASTGSSTGYQLYTYNMTATPKEYYLSDIDKDNESDGYSSAE